MIFIESFHKYFIKHKNIFEFLEFYRISLKLKIKFIISFENEAKNLNFN